MVCGPSSSQAVRLVLRRIRSDRKHEPLERLAKASRALREKLRPSWAAAQQARQQDHCLELVHDDVLGESCYLASPCVTEVKVHDAALEVEAALPSGEHGLDGPQDAIEAHKSMARSPSARA